MAKKIALTATALLVAGLLWYLFIMPQDYLVRFHTKALPGTVNQIVKFWAGQRENASFVEQKNLGDFTSTLTQADTTLTFRWEISRKNDSTSLVKVKISDHAHSLKNRIGLPFSDTDFEKRSKSTVKEVYTLLQEHLSEFKTKVVGEAVIPEKYCLCVPLENTQLKKVTGMMQYYSKLSNFVAKNGMEPNGRPMVEVENWNNENDSIAYNFCFPIVKTDSLPQEKGIIYKQIKERKALKAIYNGNYLTSDRAWYALLDYAERNDIPLVKTPLEVFHSNPNMGGNELDWKTEIFMPIKERK
ncbi:GyrI-like domain-containing protein [Zobellia uliginosa]|uniref:GyrI-like domain-containing protein n=1 Tax=Zobellia uliginosa TaxID=143224 RepID=UPI0026E39FAF|nr:GyrI-like domain-containing protein [Zobellia uliginosa]MDO6515715.1 GyrI-like domain-containing protein [Zobellia uliginosa]